MAHNVHPQMWDDAKFLSFDDTTRILWVCLLTGPLRKSLPGLFRASVTSLADTLQRPPELIQTSLTRLLDERMVEHDPQARVLCLPNAPKWSSRPNQTQLVAWFAQWRELPVCEIKYAHIPRLEALVDPKHARAPIQNAWARTFGDPKNLERQGWIELAPDPLPHTPSPDLRSTKDLDLQKRVNRDAIHRAGSEFDNIREKEQNDSVNSEGDLKTKKVRGAHKSPEQQSGKPFKVNNENESLRVTDLAPATSNFKTEASENPSVESWQNADLEGRPDIQNEQYQQHTSTILRKNENSKKPSESARGNQTQPAETTRDRQGEAKSQASKIHDRDRIPEWCLPKAGRKRSPTPP